jgi:hypothetical protein
MNILTLVIYPLKVNPSKSISQPSTYVREIMTTNIHMIMNIQKFINIYMITYLIRKNKKKNNLIVIANLTHKIRLTSIITTNINTKMENAEVTDTIKLMIITINRTDKEGRVSECKQQFFMHYV